MERTIPTVPPRSRRWVSEMEEIRDTFAHLGWTLRISSGVSEGIYKSVVQDDGEFLRIEAGRRQ